MATGMRDQLLEVPPRINLRVGESRQLRLPGLGSAGYGWRYSIEGPGQAVSITMGREGGPVPNEPGGPPPSTGSSMSVITIAGRQPGSTQVLLELRRQWEGTDKPPKEQHRIEVTVEG